MKGRRKGTLAVLASLMLMSSVTTAGWTEEAGAPDDPGGGDRAIGVIGSILCGGEMLLIKTNPLIGMNPYVLAAGIGGCLLMGLDMIT